MLLLISLENINARFSQFFQVYSSRAQFPLSDFLNSLDFPALTADARADLEKDITLVEVQGAIGRLQGGKTLGIDGLPTEFYSQK